MADTIRLNKVLRELNISIDRVADFLESIGHTIEKRPTTKISKDLYSLLCDEFQIDADKKIASKEVVEAKNKEVAVDGFYDYIMAESDFAGEQLQAKRIPNDW